MSAITQEKQSSALYARDFYSWTQRQADALRALRGQEIGGLDLENLIEEIEDMGRSERKAWQSNCYQGVKHLLLMECWGSVNPPSLTGWITEVKGFRREMANAIKENPGLQGSYAEMYGNALRDGTEAACDKLVEMSCDADPSLAEREARRYWQQVLTEKTPYEIHEVTAFELTRDKLPRHEWPSSVAAVLSEQLGGEYRVAQAPRTGKLARAVRELRVARELLEGETLPPEGGQVLLRDIDRAAPSGPGRRGAKAASRRGTKEPERTGGWER